MKDELKALFQEGHRRGGGPLSRQRSEPIESYFERRERWLEMLIAFDMEKTIRASGITKEMQGELALDNAMVTDMERKLILTVTQNSTDYDAIKKCMLIHQNL